MKLNKITLKKLLKEKKISVRELHANLTKNGVLVNYAYLARLLAIQNDLPINSSLIYAIAGVLNIDVNTITENENSTPAPSVYTLKKPDENIALKIENLALKVENLSLEFGNLSARLAALENKNRD